MFVCEGEKDADNLHRLGYDAASGEDGAGPGKRRKEYTEQLRERAVCIFQDNDDIGRAYAQETAAALYGVASSVQVLDISTVWPKIPEHGDVSDLIARTGAEKACELIAKLTTTAPQWTPAPDPFLACFKSLDSFAEEEATWLIPGWIPEGQITLMAADGGIGKTTLAGLFQHMEDTGPTITVDLGVPLTSSPGRNTGAIADAFKPPKI